MYTTQQRIVAVDLDNVVSATDEKLRQIIERLSRTKLSQDQICTWYYSEALVATGIERSVAKQIEQDALNLFHEKECATVEPISGAIDGLSRLLDAGVQIAMVTARPRTDMCEALTRKWLAEVGVQPEVLVMGRKKAEALDGWAYLIDDSPHDAQEVADRGVSVLILDYSWNRSVPPHPLITRVVTWHDILQVLLLPPAAASAV
jgi:5'(3')-deoxyribonucleotidase